MKRLVLLVIPVVLFVLGGCATPIENTDLSKFTHSDLQNAARIATQNGFPARAAVWTANDQLLSAWEKQVDACNQAILAMKPTAPSGTIGVATATEIAAEAVGSGVPPAVKLNCEPLPVPNMLVFPKIP